MMIQKHLKPILGMLAATAVCLALCTTASAATGDKMAATPKTAHDFSFKSLDESRDIALKDFAGKVVLVVNTASACGFTPQYEGLEKLWQDYKDKGLVVLGVPSNDFGQQEPGSAREIADFCKLNYGVTFTMTQKNSVSGKDAHPFYQWAAAQSGILEKPRWNFHKYLIGRDGALIRGYTPLTKPQDPKLIKAIEAALAAPAK